MPGYSIAQISALTGATKSYFRQNAHKIKGATKDRLEWRFPLDGLSKFVISNEKILVQFKENMQTVGAFPTRYTESGKLLEEKIEALLEEERNRPIEMLTTKDIVSLPLGDFFQYSRQVSELCRTKQLFAVKTNTGRFAHWNIPTESFAMYLVFHTDEFIAFLDMRQEYLSYWKERDDNMFKIVHSINQYLDKVSDMFDETYTAREIADIFDLPLNEVLSRFFAVILLGKIRVKIPPITKESSVSWRAVADYMHNDPDKVQYLYDKWEKLETARKQCHIEKETDKEYKIRHLLMMYEYYIQAR